MFQGIRRANNQLLNKEPELENLVSEEKDVLSALKLLQKETDEAGSYILKWCQKEHSDIKDVCSYFGGLDADFAQVIANMANRQTIYRQKLKEIKRLHDVVIALGKRHTNAAANTISGSNDEEIEIRKLLAEAEAEFESKKRTLLKEGMNQKYQGWAETASKVLVF